jgi:NADH:ubiquinone oxidoreductase subunit F (NADH-binding)
VLARPKHRCHNALVRKRREGEAQLIDLRALTGGPISTLQQLSVASQTPLYRLHGLTTFYPHLRPPPSAVEVCTDLSCRLAQPHMIETLAAAGHSVSPRSCLGLCDRPVAVALDGEIRGDASTNRIAEPTGESPATLYSHARLIDPQHAVPYASLARVAGASDPLWVLRELESSGLRGFGGAGFPTQRKWELVRRDPAEEKFVICNADESEPGTFKDRFLLERYPHLVVEGLVIAALVVGARRAYVFLRHEYRAQKRALQEAIASARTAGAVGESIFGSASAVEIEIFVSPGGYICGEETALLEAMEGKRAEPRNRPPFPGTRGLWGQPTLINNVETLAWVPAILAHGGAWFRDAGRNGASGMKLIALSGHVERPGVYEIPLGLPVRELIEQHGGGVSMGRRLKAFAPGGASSGFLPAAQSEIPLDFAALSEAGSMLGSGAVVVLAEGTCMLDAALSVLRFFRNESCGKCVPCRVGTEKLVRLAEGWTVAEGAQGELGLVAELAEAMRTTSICGLGQAAPNPLTSVVKHFPSEVEAHLHGRCPEGVCR